MPLYRTGRPRPGPVPVASRALVLDSVLDSSRPNWPGAGATIRDMTSVPDRARVRLTGISSRAYEHPADRSALVALRKLSGFDTLLKRLFGLFNERAFRLTYLGSSVRVSERQFPHIHEMVRDGAYI